MYKILRIVFCVLAAICAAVTIFIFTYFGVWGCLPLGLALLSAGLMFYFKRAQELEEYKANPPEPRGDFITGKVKKEDTDGKE